MHVPSSLQINRARSLCRVAALACVLASPLTVIAASPTLDPSFGANGIVDQPFLGKGGIASGVAGLRDGKILASGSYVFGRGGRGAILVSTSVLARYNADGSHDVGFGIQGILDPSTAYFWLLQRDGKMVGYSQTGLTRFNPDGSPDAGFILDGAAGIPWFAGMSPGGLAQQADGRIVVAGTVGAGTAALVLLRFNTDGSLDPTFNYGGALIVPHGDSSNDLGSGLIIQPDGKLVMAASSDTGVGTARTFTLIRYWPDGSLDSTFGDNGRASAKFGSHDQDDAVAVVRQPDGRLIVVGTDAVLSTDNSMSTTSLLLVGFSADGFVDSSFGANGAVRITIGDGSLGMNVNDVKVQADGKLLVAFGSDFNISTYRLTRFTVDGAPDIAFGASGTLTSSGLPGIQAIELQPDGNLVLGGVSSANDFALARYIDGPSAVIEFHHAALDHYFLSMNPQEVNDLDLGVHAGWKRTGQSFQVFGSAAAASGTSANPACRFYIPPQHGDSHFFSADPVECQNVLNNMVFAPSYSGYVYETPNAFYVNLPDQATGACPAGTIPVYRLWNRRADSNHRYTTSVAIKDQMVANGYIVEGYGPNPVDMCAPQ